MLDNYICNPNFAGFTRIEGIPYVIMKRTDADIYRYRVLKIENGREIMVFRCDTVAQARAELKEIRMNLRDSRIRATRQNLEARGIDYSMSHSTTAIYEAYYESIQE